MGDLLDRYEVCRELIKVVTEDFPTAQVMPDGTVRGHMVESVTSMVMGKAVRRILDLPGVPLPAAKKKVKPAAREKGRCAK
jgi:hypothetical protein